MKVLLNVTIIIFYAAISSFGLYKMKVAASPLSFDAVAGLACYVAGFLIWLVILRMLPLSVAFPSAAGVLVVSTQIVGVYFLNEHLGAAHLTGIALILAGIGVMFARAG